MMLLNRARRGAAMACVLGAAFLSGGSGLSAGAGPTVGAGRAGDARSPDAASLDRLERGQWELRENGARGVPYRRICLGDPRQLLQPRHAGQACGRYIVTDEGTDHVTVAYSCPSGSGRTSLRIETSRLVQIHSNGVADSAPFALSLEGRRVGDCR